MWKPTNQPSTTPTRPTEPERPTISTPSAPAMSSHEPPVAPRPATTTTADQATIGKSLVIKGEVTGSESLYIDGRVEGSINLSGNRVTVGRNGVVAAKLATSSRLASRSKTAPTSRAASTSAKAARSDRRLTARTRRVYPPPSQRSRRQGRSFSDSWWVSWKSRETPLHSVAP